jgi:hypothetical protein
MEDALDERMRVTDFRPMKVAVDELILSDRCYSDGTPCKVRVYKDDTTNTSYQVDYRGNMWRKASSATVTNYGPWNQLDKSK